MAWISIKRFTGLQRRWKSSRNPSPPFIMRPLWRGTRESQVLALEWVRKCLGLQPRHRGVLDLSLLMDPHQPVKRRPETLRKIDRLRKKKRPLSVGIHTRSDREKDPQMRLLWGDYWVKKELEKELSRLGFDLSQRHPDIHIHLFGSPSGSYDEDALNLVWLYSHPDQGDHR